MLPQPSYTRRSRAESVEINYRNVATPGALNQSDNILDALFRQSNDSLAKFKRKHARRAENRQRGIAQLEQSLSQPGLNPRSS